MLAVEQFEETINEHNNNNLQHLDLPCGVGYRKEEVEEEEAKKTKREGKK